MKKKILIVTAMMTGVINHAFAATGNASDGLLGSLVIMGVLLIVAGILFTIDYLNMNGRRVMHSVLVTIKKALVFINRLITYSRQVFPSRPQVTS